MQSTVKAAKPFYWGGLKGFQQLDAIAKVLHAMAGTSAETAYFQQLTHQVDRALEQNRELADGLQEAHTWLRRIAACLRYPPRSHPDFDSVTSQQIAQEMDTLLQQLRHQAQAGHQVLKTLYCAADLPLEIVWQGLIALLRYSLAFPLTTYNWKASSTACVVTNAGSVAANPPRNCAISASIRCSLWLKVKMPLLEQLRRVPIPEYRQHRRRLAQAEVPPPVFPSPSPSPHFHNPKTA